jgi:Spy/CpxP family protein refolding chaperone
MKTLRFYKLLIVVLILLNITTISFFWFTAKRPGPPDKNELVELLDLQGQTKTKILAMQDDHFKQKNALVQKSRDLHEQLFRSFNDASKDSTAVSNLIDRIVENQRETEQMTFNYFKEVSELCTPEQREKLQELIHEVLRRAGGPPPPKK